MNKKLFYAMSRRRVSCPQMTQQLWDAIKTIRYQRQVSDIDRIARFMNRVHNIGLEEVTRQLNYCVRDGLLHLTKRVGIKGSKAGIETESYNLPPTDKMEKDSHDWYCFECHRGGDVISCNSCHRVYHLACIAKEELPDTDVKHKFVCTVCKMIETKDDDFDIKKSQMNRLLRLTLRRLKQRLPMSLTERHMLCNPSATPFVYERQNSIRKASSELPSTIKWVNDDKDLWRQNYLLYRPMDLDMMDDKVKANKYESLEEFKADAQTIVHNVVIYHGVHSNVADHARLMLRDCTCDLQEIRQCRDCYKVTHEKNKYWFCKPCRPPHVLVYAKQKGFPYWPAKVIKITGDMYDVRFFGGDHQRSTIEKAFIRPISININSLQVKKTSLWNKACEELKRHQDLLEKLKISTQNFTIPSPDSSSDDSDDDCVKEISTNKVPEIAEESKEEEPSQSDLSDMSDDDQDAPLVKRLKQDKTAEENIIPTTKKYQRVPSKNMSFSIPKTLTGKRRPGRPPRNIKQLVNKKVELAQKSSINNVSETRRRGRPPGAKNKTSAMKQQIIEMQRKLEKEFEERKKQRDEEKRKEEIEVEEDQEESELDQKEQVVESDVQVEEKEEISSTSVQVPVNKKEEEEIVSSSCQEPQVRSVGVQTRPITPPLPTDDKSETEVQPEEDVSKKTQEDALEEKNREIERLKEEYLAEIAGLEEKNKQYITEIKKKQWCYNCEAEAIYHCCWNTAYCSIDCQQLHWQKEHKRVCRRKR